MDNVKMQRQWLKSNFTDWDDIKSDQDKKLPQPPLEKPNDTTGEVINLPEVNDRILAKTNILSLMNERKSRRKYTEEALSLEELSFLLWATQGVKRVMPNKYAAIRLVPSAGARHPFETYLAVYRVEGLKKGIYRYMALSHQLVYLFEDENVEQKITEATLGQSFVGSGAVTFMWSCVPYRGEWRYNISAHKMMLLDAGHVCQNLYLASEAIGCGTCAIGAYNQAYIDKMLEIDGENEFVIYLSPVGKVEK